MIRNTQYSDSLVSGSQNLINSSPFNLGQCIYSSMAHENRIDNYPGIDYVNQPLENELSKDNIIKNLHKLFKHCINPILKRFGSNLILTSVYRNKQLNKLLGGVVNSQHIYGYAADIAFADGTPSSALFNWCKVSLPQYHQLIWEYPEKGNYYPFQIIPTPGGVVRIEDPGQKTNINFSWVHISYIEGSNDKVNSVSSTDPKIHTAYKDENTFYLDNFTHRIARANQKILE